MRTCAPALCPRISVCCNSRGQITFFNTNLKLNWWNERKYWIKHLFKHWQSDGSQTHSDCKVFLADILGNMWMYMIFWSTISHSKNLLHKCAYEGFWYVQTYTACTVLIWWTFTRRPCGNKYNFIVVQLYNSLWDWQCIKEKCIQE